MSPRRYPQIAARQLIRDLRRAFGYDVVRQRGSHIRIRTIERGEHSITVPDHNPLRIGTLVGIMKDVAQHFEISEDEVLARIRGTGRRGAR